MPEGDEDPDESAAGIARELQHERKWSLGRGRVDEGQVQLRAPGELGRVGPHRLAREEIVERDPVLLGLRACSSGDLQRAAGEAADCFAPDRVVKAHGQARRAYARARQPSPSATPS